MKQIFIIALILSFGLTLKAQDKGIRVYLKDKGSSVYLLNYPEKILSQKSIERRAAQGILIDRHDLPPAPEYLKEIRRRGGRIKAKSRWLNYVYVEGINKEQLEALPFVKSLEIPKAHKSHLATSATQYDYGLGRTQIEQISGHLLHQAGYTGRGATIAVIDAGFTGTFQAPVLDSLRQSGRLKGSYNFVSGDTNVYTGQGSHGAAVLSTMAALDSGAFVGTAPHANYWLLTSENIGSETPLEMDHWLMAAEFADSVGAQVINTSLGYTTFDDPSDSFTYADMDGNTTLVSRAADWAASRGIIVVASAGNEGAGSWQRIGAPADGDSVLAVGAVDASGAYVSFSSRGPSYDWRVKPDVAAMGAGTVLINSLGQVQSGFGTSFSSPLVAGMAACIVQAQPTLGAQQIADNIRRSGHQYGNADNNLGYGIPNFYEAYRIDLEDYEKVPIKVYPNPARERVFIQGSFEKGEKLELSLRNQSGRLIRQSSLRWQNYAIKLNLEDLAPGVYFLLIEGQETYREKILLR